MIWRFSEAANPFRNGMIERAVPYPPVPERYIGLWQRRLLQDAQGEDRTTQVYWLQTGSLYADIRIPVSSGDRSMPETLAQQQGFAGTLKVEEDVLTWRRWLNYQPPDPVPDSGRMRFTGLNEMLEEGVHAQYQEIWERIGPASGDRAAFELQVEYGSGEMPRRRAGVLVMVGDYFMYTLDRLTALPAGRSLAELLQDSRLDARQREQLFGCEISFGRRRMGVTPWEITLSTLPKHEGRSLFAVHGALKRAAAGRFEQRMPWTSVRRLWRQVECGASFRELG